MSTPSAGPPGDPTTRLARRLGLRDAVLIGLGSMIGAGIFASFGPAAQAAGTGMLIGLAIAGVVAYCNAASSAQLAALYPQSGGTYVYGRRRLGHLWGFLAGWSFVVGKTASCAAMALTFGAYVAPDLARPMAIGAVVALTAVNLFGVQKTALATRVIVVIVLATLAVVVVVGAGAASGDVELGSVGVGGVRGVLESAGLLFFAFAGYARLATLGEEVRDPARTIPRAIPLALGITLVVYAVVAEVSLLAVGPDELARSPAPLTSVVEAAGASWAGAVVRVGAAIATLGVLLSLIAGVSRTAFAMAAERDLPSWFDAVHPVSKVPHRAELAVGIVVMAVVAVADLRGAIGFSSFAVLMYYAVANASALTLGRDERRWPPAVAALGLVGCVVVAVFLPLRSVIGGLVLLTLGVAVWAIRQRFGPTSTAPQP